MQRWGSYTNYTNYKMGNKVGMEFRLLKIWRKAEKEEIKPCEYISEVDRRVSRQSNHPNATPIGCFNVGTLTLRKEQNLHKLLQPLVYQSLMF